MSSKITRPDQYYRKNLTPPKDIPDIRNRILPIFAVLLVVELVIAVSALRFWRQQSLVNEDQQTLFRANEIIAECRQDSLQLGRLLNLAIASPTTENINAYAALVQKKTAPVLNAPPTPDTILNTLSDVTPANLKLRNSSISFGEAEWLRFDRVADDFQKLRAIDENALALLRGRTPTGEVTPGVAQRADPEAIRAILTEQSYEARRIRLNDDFSAMQAALDFRTLTLLNDQVSNGWFFFNIALGGFALLLPATILIGLFLHKYQARIYGSHKSQVRRLNDELSRLRGDLAIIEAERGHTPPPDSGMGL
jgi:hypothetical protein